MSDVWPRRNLGRAENWGRKVEGRINLLKRTGDIQDQSQDGFGRMEASTSGTLQDNANRLQNALSRLPRMFTASNYGSGFPLGTEWSTVASVTVPTPPDYTSVGVSALGTCTSYHDGSLTDLFIWPFSLSYVTSEFGPRPPLPFHNGIDFSYSGILGTDIPATHDGTVILRGFYSDWGNYTRLDCSTQTGHAGDWTGYAHMNAPGLYGVGTGVVQGQTIGYVGNTGESTGPHLHYETATGSPVERINPRTFMDIYGGSSTSLYKVTARLMIDGTPSLEFQPYRGDDVPRSQSIYPVHGASKAAGSSVLIELQMRATGAVPARPENTATLTTQGGFTRG